MANDEREAKSVAATELPINVRRFMRGIVLHLVGPADSQSFQGLFGMVLTVLIAIEFKHTLLVVRHYRCAIVQVRSVVSIALLSPVRRFIILDRCQTTPSLIAALAGAALALGIVFWLVSNREEPQEAEAQEGFAEPGYSHDKPGTRLAAAGKIVPM